MPVYDDTYHARELGHDWDGFDARAIARWSNAQCQSSWGFEENYECWCIGLQFWRSEHSRDDCREVPSLWYLESRLDTISCGWAEIEASIAAEDSGDQQQCQQSACCGSKNYSTRSVQWAAQMLIELVEGVTQKYGGSTSGLFWHAPFTVKPGFSHAPAGTVW